MNGDINFSIVYPTDYSYEQYAEVRGHYGMPGKSISKFGRYHRNQRIKALQKRLKNLQSGYYITVGGNFLFKFDPGSRTGQNLIASAVRNLDRMIGAIDIHAANYMFGYKILRENGKLTRYMAFWIGKGAMDILGTSNFSHSSVKRGLVKWLSSISANFLARKQNQMQL
jgi:hypothetical protein